MTEGTGSGMKIRGRATGTFFYFPQNGTIDHILPLSDGIDNSFDNHCKMVSYTEKLTFMHIHVSRVFLRKGMGRGSNRYILLVKK